jgi:hypothetical protein
VEEAFYELVRVFFVDFFGSVLHLPLATVYLGQSLLTPSFSGPRNPPSNRHKNQYPCLCSREKRKEERRLQRPLNCRQINPCFHFTHRLIHTWLHQQVAAE